MEKRPEYYHMEQRLVTPEMMFGERYDGINRLSARVTFSYRGKVGQKWLFC
jgi:hypothetical protein